MRETSFPLSLKTVSKIYFQFDLIIVPRMTMNTETLEKELRLDENYEQSDWFSEDY